MVARLVSADSDSGKLPDVVNSYLGTFLASKSQLAAAAGSFENFTPANFRRWRAAIARSRAGGKVARVSVYGDSNTTGFQLASGSDYSRSYGERARSIIDGSFGPARRGLVPPVIYANGSQFQVIDPAYTLGSAWKMSTATGQGIGENRPVEASSTGGTLDFAATGVNSFTIYAARYGGGPQTMRAWIDSESATTFSLQGATDVAKITVSTATVGSHVLHVEYGGSGTAYVNAIEAFDSTLRGSRWTYVGIPGGVVNQWAATAADEPWAPNRFSYTSSGADPDVVVFNLMINSHSQAQPILEYKNQLRVVINQARVQADVILVASAAAGSGDASTWSDYLQAQRELAIELGCGLINVQGRWGAYSLANAAPYSFWADTDHPTVAGYWDMGEALASGLRLAAGRSA